MDKPTPQPLYIWDVHCYDFLLSGLSRKELVPFGRFLRAMDYAPRVSPINVVEVAGINRDPRRRTRLFHAMSAVHGGNLLPSPEVLLAAVVARAVGDRRLAHYLDRSKWQYGRNALVANRALKAGDSGALTQAFSMSHLQRSQAATRASLTWVGRPTEYHSALVAKKPHEYLDHEEWETYWTAMAKTISAEQKHAEARPIVEKAVAHYFHVILAGAETPFGDDLNHLWEALDLPTMAERAALLQRYWPQIGGDPISKLVILISASQAMLKYGRGHLLDLLQCVYLPEGYTLATEDTDLRGLLEGHSGNSTHRLAVSGQEHVAALIDEWKRTNGM